MEERYFKFEDLMADLAAYLVSEYDIEPRDAAGLVMNSPQTQALYSSEEPISEQRVKKLAEDLLKEGKSDFPEERHVFEYSIKADRDINNAINTAKKEAKEEGREEGRMEGLAEGKAKANMDNARKMKADGMPAELIAKYTSLSIEEIEKL